MKKSIIPLLLLASSAAIAQQNEGSVPLSVCHSGSWFTPATAGEGYNLDVLPNGNAAFYFYTYADNGNPLFYTGALNRIGDCVSGQMFFSFGGRMFSDQNPANVDRLPLFNATICIGRGQHENYPQNNWGVIIFTLNDDPDTVEDESQTFVAQEFIRLTPKHEDVCDG